MTIAIYSEPIFSIYEGSVLLNSSKRRRHRAVSAVASAFCRKATQAATPDTDISGQVRNIRLITVHGLAALDNSCQDVPF